MCQVPGPSIVNPPPAVVETAILIVDHQEGVVEGQTRLDSNADPRSLDAGDITVVLCRTREVGPGGIVEREFDVLDDGKIGHLDAEPIRVQPGRARCPARAHVVVHGFVDRDEDELVGTVPRRGHHVRLFPGSRARERGVDGKGLGRETMGLGTHENVRAAGHHDIARLDDDLGSGIRQ